MVTTIQHRARWARNLSICAVLTAIAFSASPAWAITQTQTAILANGGGAGGAPGCVTLLQDGFFQITPCSNGSISTSQTLGAGCLPGHTCSAFDSQFTLHYGSNCVSVIHERGEDMMVAAPCDGDLTQNQGLAWGALWFTNAGGGNECAGPSSTNFENGAPLLSYTIGNCNTSKMAYLPSGFVTEICTQTTLTNGASPACLEYNLITPYVDANLGYTNGVIQAAASWLPFVASNNAVIAPGNSCTYSGDCETIINQGSGPLPVLLTHNTYQAALAGEHVHLIRQNLGGSIGMDSVVQINTGAHWRVPSSPPPQIDTGVDADSVAVDSYAVMEFYIKSTQ